MESKNTEEKFIEIIKDICYTSNDKGFVVPEFDIVKCIIYIIYIIIFFI